MGWGCQPVGTWSYCTAEHYSRAVITDLVILEMVAKFAVVEPAGLLHLAHGLGVAKLVEEGDVGVDLVDPAEAHGEGGRAEVLEGQLEAFPVECQR